MDDTAGAPGERIAKVMARAGLCSRREAETWLAAGRVSVGGRTITDPATRIDPQARLEIDGKPAAGAERTRLWRYHKPRGLVCTNRDPQGRPTVFAALPRGMPRVVSVGRLDISSEGLLLLTNDGALARRLELPATGWTRRYRARVHGAVDEAALAKLANGVTVEGARYGPIRAVLEHRGKTNSWIGIALKEGRNREVRRVLNHLGLEVSRLIRTAYGPFQLGALAEAAVDEVPARVLADQLGGGAPPDERKRGNAHHRR